jgi:hypothetical protein
MPRFAKFSYYCEFFLNFFIPKFKPAAGQEFSGKALFFEGEAIKI